VFYVVIAAQFCGTSLWFAGNAAIPQLQQQFSWDPSAVAYITSATQFGFIAGTLAFAMAGLADRISPSILFLLSSILASLSNAWCLTDLSSYPDVLISRVLTGFFLAGIYPVGMKIASDWNPQGLGHWLGALVGALVIGTALPHGLKNIPGFIDSQTLLIAVSALAVTGGILVGVFVGDGPFRKKSTGFTFAGLSAVFSNRAFRIPAFGYFGHMWELYAFWAFVPAIIERYEAENGTALPALLTFLVIASGAFGSVMGGRLSQRVGSYSVAFYALALSGLCCLLSPAMFLMTPTLFVVFILSWGFFVVADSPQFSALVANNAPPEVKGSAITIVTCIGFSITILSIQLLSLLRDVLPAASLFLLLLPGPLFGVFSLAYRQGKKVFA
jgi:MFS family permease